MAPPNRIYTKRLNAELLKVKESYPVEVVDDDISKWKVEIDVPDYGMVLVLISFPPSYPFSPPQIKIPRILHPNIYKTGKLCMSILHEGKVQVGDTESIDEKWTPSIWMTSLLASLVSVLITPNLDSPADVDARKLYVSNFPEYLRRNGDLAKLREDDKIKEEQDRAFKNASDTDQRKDQLKKQERFNKELKAEETVRARSKLSPEPDQTCGKDVIKLRLRTPSSTLSRTFLATDPMSQVVLFMQSEGFSAVEYKLLSSWPRRDLSKLDPNATLQSLKFSPQEIITMEAINHDVTD